MLTFRILRSKSVFVLTLFSVVLAGSVLSATLRPGIDTIRAADNEHNQNIKALLMRLNSDRIQPRLDNVTIYFVSPIGDGLNRLTIPDFRDGNSPYLEIEEIGDDHFCIADIAGEILLRCIPFTNIASIIYSAY